MPGSSRRFFREIVSAVAVLAIYMLVLLAPLHQAAALQRDLNALGYFSIDETSICASLAKDKNGQPVAKCAVAGIGKNEIAGVEPVVIDFDILVATSCVRYYADKAFHACLSDYHPRHPRAPPVSV